MAYRFLGVDALWALAMALNVYLALFRGWTAQRMQAQEWKYFIGAYGLSFIPALTYLFLKDHSRGRVYGPALVSTLESISVTVLIGQTALVLDSVRMGLPPYGNLIRHCLVRTSTPQKNLPQTKNPTGSPSSPPLQFTASPSAKSGATATPSAPYSTPSTKTPSAP